MATIPASQLTYAEIGRIVNEFDHAHFGVSKSPVGLTKEYRNVHFAFLGLNLPPEVVDGIARQYIASAPSVRSLLVCYLGAPSCQNTALRDPRFLNGAAVDLLKKAHIELSPKKEDLVHFKQLMDAVLIEYFNKLSVPQQIEMVKKIQGTTWEVENAELPAGNNLSVKLNQLQQKLQMNQAGWDKAKVQLQFASWKVQLVIARVLSSFGARVCLMVGSGYCAVRTYFWLKTIGYKIAYKFGQNFENLSEYGLRTLGVDPHERGGNFPLKAVVILTTILLSSVVGGAYLVARIHIFCKDRFPPLLLDIVEWPFVTVSKLINDPAGVAYTLGFGIYNIGESLTAHVAQSMDAAAVASQKKYIQDKIPTLKDGWCQIVLNPPTVKV